MPVESVGSGRAGDLRITIDSPVMPGIQQYLDPHTLAAISPLEMRARMIVEGLMIGMHRSPYQGFSVDFAQHRQYAPGDDLRHLDWKVFARTDKLYLKQYQKETNLDLMVMVDTSGSMAYGSELTHGHTAAGKRYWRKFDHAASLAVAIAYLALKQNDRVALMMFADTARQATRLSNAGGQWRAIVESLAAEKLLAGVPGSRGMISTDQTGRRTDIAVLMDRMVAKLNRRSLLVLISDLFDEPSALERGLAKLYHSRHDVIILHVLDHEELTFPFRSPSEFIGLEAEGRLGLDPSALRKGYLAALRGHLETVEKISRRFQFDYLLLDSSESMRAPLSYFLAERSGAISRRGRKH